MRQESRARNIAHFEAQTVERLSELIADLRSWEHRPLKAGPYRRHRLTIHSRRISPRRDLLTADRLAHLLSREADSLAAPLTDLACDLLIIPELLEVSDQIVTHIYLPEKRLLAFYLYPLRLHRRAGVGSLGVPPDEVDSFAATNVAPLSSSRIERQIPLGEPTLLHSLVTTLTNLQLTALSAPRPHHFLLPRNAIEKSEWMELLSSDSLYSLAKE